MARRPRRPPGRRPRSSRTSRPAAGTRASASRTPGARSGPASPPPARPRPGATPATRRARRTPPIPTTISADAHQQRRERAVRADRPGDHHRPDDVGRLDRRALERERRVHAAGVVAEHRRPQRPQARADGRERRPGERCERQRGEQRDAVGEQRERGQRGGGARPRRGSSPAPGRGGRSAARARARVTPLASAYAPAPRPPAANEPVSSRVWRMNSSPRAVSGSRAGERGGEQRARSPGTRRRLEIETRWAVAVAMRRACRSRRARREGFGPRRIGWLRSGA